VTRTKVLLYRGTRVRQDELRGVPLHVPGHPGRAGDRRTRFEIRRGEHGVGEVTDRDRQSAEVSAQGQSRGVAGSATRCRRRDGMTWAFSFRVGSDEPYLRKYQRELTPACVGAMIRARWSAMVPIVLEGE
jgi:hypothetical protein